MFTRLAKSRLAGFRFIQPRQIMPRLSELVFYKDTPSNNSHSNDDLPDFRHPVAKGKRGSPSPALACHWSNRNGRLECCWTTVSSGDVQIDDVDEHEYAQGGVLRLSSKRSRRFILAPAG